MKGKADKEYKKLSTLITLSVGLAIGVSVTASFLALFDAAMPLWIPFSILIFIIIISFIFASFWIFKGEFFEKIFGVKLKNIPHLVNDICDDISVGDFKDIKVRIYEAAVVWSSYKTRTAFIGLLLLLTTSLFLMLNAYVMYKQIKIMKINNSILEKQIVLEEFKLSEMLFDKAKGEHAETFSKIVASVEACDYLYEKNNGKYKHGDINDYLAIIDELAMYEKAGVIPLDKINKRLRLYILAFYRNNNGEIKDYVSVVQKAYSETFYEDLISLVAKLEAIPENKKLLIKLKNICDKAEVRRQKNG